MSERSNPLLAPFAGLILAQAAHSVEEYAGRLWETFPPARLVSGLVSSDLERGFVIANVVLVGFGAWCALWPVRRGWPAAVAVAWGWVVVETINGIGHPLWSLRQGGYTPGVGTAPVLLALAIWLARRLLRHDIPGGVTRPGGTSAPSAP